MRAADLVEPQATVEPTTPVSAAATLLAQGRPGVVVTRPDGTLLAVLSAPQLLRLMLPGYLRDDPDLATALGVQAADEVCRDLTRGTVGDLVRSVRRPDVLSAVELDATALEVAAVLARTSSPLLAVLRDGRVVGVVTATRLLLSWVPPAVP